MRTRAAVADRNDEQVSLSDIIEMVRDVPPRSPKVEAVDPKTLPRARVPIHAPVPAGPGMCELVVPVGSPMPPGTRLMHSLTTELVEAYQRQQRWERSRHEIVNAHSRLDELDRFVQEIAAQRSRVLEQLAMLEAMEPVEPLDWENIARRIWKVTGFKPIPDQVWPEEIAGISHRNEGLDDVVNYRSDPPRDRLGRRLRR